MTPREGGSRGADWQAQTTGARGLQPMAENQIRRQPANCNSPPADFRLVEIEASRGPQNPGLVHVSVPVRRVLARALTRYRDRIGNGDAA
jgi:hypothetical protein